MTFVDPNIARKNALQNAHLQSSGRLPGGEPFFSHVEFSISGLCNRTCIFCPRVDPKIYPNLNEHLPLGLYERILRDLNASGYTGGISYSGFSEPLLHPDLVDLLRASHHILPESRLEIVSNGDRVTPQLLREFFDAGLNTFLISMYDGPEQIPYFESIIKESGLTTDNVILRKRYLPPEEGYGINLTNRAGNVTLSGSGIGALAAPLDNACYYTHYRMMVDHKGDVLLCPHDWSKKVVVGNLHNQNIIDIWTGPALSNIRKKLGSADRSFSPCNVCDVVGTRQGGEHFQAWQEFYREDLLRSDSGA